MMTTNSTADITKYAALIINNNGEVLFARKYNKDTWINIGGRVEGNETPLECLRRELKEELQCDIKESPVPKEFLRTPATPVLDDPNKTVQIIWYKLEINGDPIPSNEIEEVKWIDLKDPKVKLSPQIEEYLVPGFAD